MTNNITNIEEMFNETSTYQAYLDVEVALANAQAKQGIIPQKAAETIKEFAKIELLDLDTIHEGLKVSVNQTSENWVEIELMDGKTGWIENHQIRLLQ